MMKWLLLLTGLAMTPLAGAGQATRYTVDGTWQVTWDSGVRTEGDRVIEVTRRSTATLQLSQNRDSLSGTWTTEQEPDRPVRVHGVLEGNSLRLTAEPWSVRERGRALRFRLTMAAEAGPDGLNGTLFLQLDDRPAVPRSWKAVRVAGR